MGQVKWRSSTLCGGLGIVLLLLLHSVQPNHLEAADDGETVKDGETRLSITLVGRFEKIDPNDVKEMTIELYNHPLGHADLGPREIDKRHYPAVLEYFSECEPTARMSPNDVELGSIRLKGINGRVVRMSWYQFDHCPLVFSIAGVRMVAKRQMGRDAGLALDALCRRIVAEGRGK